MLTSIKKKGEMGIGTLIIFIAMILVAAIAAGVLVTTASSLQNKALLTGTRSKTQVSTRVLPISLYGEDGSDGNIEYLYWDIKLAPGSDQVKFSETLVSIALSDDSSSYQFIGTDQIQNCTNQTLLDNNPDKYDIAYLIGGKKIGYLERGDVVRICFKSPRSINEDEEILVRMILKVGNPTILRTVTPQIMTSEKVFMYP